MKITKTSLFLLIFIFSSTLLTYAQEKGQQNLTSNFIINKSFDTCWNRLMQFFFDEDYDLKGQFRTDKGGKIRIDFRNGKLSYIDPKTKLVKDTLAIALAEVKKRSGNFNYIYPNAGNFECLISVYKTSQKSTQVTIKIDSLCVMTEYYENFYLEKRRKTEDVEITSTGWFERNIKLYLF